MANSIRHAINYKPRMTDYEALEVLPKPIADALRFAVTEWDAYYILRQYRKDLKAAKGWPKDIVNKYVNLVKEWDLHFINKGWEPAKGRREKMPSPCLVLGIKPLYSESK